MVKENILVYGCGNTGSAIAKQLAEQRVYTYRGTPVHGATTLKDLYAAPKMDTVILSLAVGGPNLEELSAWGMRDSELEQNFEAVNGFAEYVKEHQPDANVIVVTNPADAYARYLSEEHGLNAIAFGKQLDLNRYRRSDDTIEAVIGPHGMSVPIGAAETLEGYLTLMNRVDMQVAQNVREQGIAYEAVAEAFKQSYDAGFRSHSVVLNKAEQEALTRSNALLDEQYGRLRQLSEEYESAHPDSNRG